MVLLRILRKSYFSKSIIVFLGINLLMSLFSTSALALTSGPTAPEYTSFEPVEASDMVGLATGDFTYNLPILEVPGPEGGYPLSLSYHAGIMPDEEASWVGLGWSLNAGAISRNVNGFADDYKSVEGSTWDYLKGGSRDVYQWNASANFKGIVVNYGQTNIYDSNKGYGRSHNFGVGIGFDAGFGKGTVGINVHSLPYSKEFIVGLQSSISGGIGRSLGGSGSVGITAGFSAGINFSSTGGVDPHHQDYLSIGAQSHGFGVSVSSTGNVHFNAGGLVNATIQSDGGIRGTALGNSLSTGSGQSQRTSTKMNVQESSYGFVVPLLVANFSYRESHIRYWFSEGDYNRLHGVLYYPTNIDPNVDACDAVHIPDLGAINGKPVNQVNGGMMPAYDNYVVLGQGMSGSIRPQLYQNQELFAQNSRDDDEVSINYSVQPRATPNKVQFEFQNEFSSFFKKNDNQTTFFATDISSLIDVLDDDEIFSQKAFTDAGTRKVGSKHIEWYTVKEIKEGIAKSNGFIRYRDEIAYRDLVNLRSVEDQIGGFSITNASGVTYHYGLPVYAFNQFSKSFLDEDYQSKTEAHPYAYTWLLTGITGPNYVDRGEPGVIDDNDYGYWVEFNYGNWSKSHGWRTPSTKDKYLKDIDGEVQTYSFGEKEIFYLDYIKTRSHTAIFEKEMRHDGKGVSDLHVGGFEPVAQSRLAPESLKYVSGDEFTQRFPTSLLKLNRILLFENNQLAEKIDGLGYNETSSLKSISVNHDLDDVSVKKGVFRKCSINGQLNEVCYDYQEYESKQDAIHNWEDVITVSDLASLNLSKSSLSSVDFSTDYSLCQNTINSLAYEDVYQNDTPINLNKHGKLTLNSIQTKGLGGEELLPSIDFEYGKNPDYEYSSEDNWSFYNSTFKGEGEVPPFISKDSKDDATAWSLTKISTPFGANINIDYSSDEYMVNAFREKYEDSYLPITGFGTVYASDEKEIKLDIREYGESAKDVFKVGETLELIVNRETNTPTSNGPGQVTPNYSYEVIKEDVEVLEIVDDNTVRIRSLLLAEYKPHQSEYAPSTRYYSGMVKYKYVPKISYGGGIRTNSVSIVTQSGDTYTTHYNYSNGHTGFLPKQVTSRLSEVWDQKLLDYVGYNTFFPLSYYAMMGLTPGVIYENVEVTESSEIGGKKTTYPERIKYTFRTPNLKDGLPNVELRNMNISGINNSEEYYRRTTKFNAGIGQLLSVIKYGENDKILTTAENTYLEDLDGVTSLSSYKNKLSELFDDQGRSDKLYYNQKNVDGNKRFVVTEVEELPSVLVKTHSKDYLTDITSNTQTLAFDVITGSVAKTLATDSEGDYFVSVIKPAYHFTPEMNSIAFGGANMLTQDGLQYSYMVDNEVDLNPVGLVSASVTKWSNTIANSKGIAIPTMMSQFSSSYIGNENSLQTNGLFNYPFANMTDEQIYALGTTDNADWFRSGEATLVTPDSKVLEYEDVNKDRHAVLYDPSKINVVASGSFTNYGELAFNSFEYDLQTEGRAVYNKDKLSNLRGHTGKFSLEVDAGGVGFNYTLNKSSLKKNRWYHASVWVYSFSSDPTQLDKFELKAEDGQTSFLATAKETKKSNGWHLVELDFKTNSNNDVELSVKNIGADRSFYIDDFRMHPIETNFTTYVYEKYSNRLSYILNSENLYTEFEYDVAGRLKRVYRERIGFNTKQLLTENIYNYGN